MVKSWMVDSILESDDMHEKRARRKANRQLKLAKEAIQHNFIAGNIEKAKQIQSRNGISDKEFNKLTNCLSRG